MENIKFEIYEKGNKEPIFDCNDSAIVFEHLAGDLLAKKVNKCNYIRSIKRVQMYTHLEIIVTYDNGTKTVYTVPANF